MKFDCTKSEILKVSFGLILVAACFAGCKSEEGPATTTSPPASSSRYLYVASGSCYGGGVTTSTGSATVVRYNLDTRALDSILIDYGAYSPGDMPVGLADYDATYLLVLVENASGRRIDLVRKDTANSASTFISNSTALSAVGRALTALSDGGYLVSKSSAIEKFSSTKARILQGANPFISAPAGSCATSTTLISDTAELPSSGKIIYTHAAATPNNKIVMISSAGYAIAGDCLAGTASPATTSLPTGVIYHSFDKLLVTFGSTTAGSNFVYSYDVNEVANTVSNATLAYSNIGIVNGPSAIVEDTDSGDVYIASAVNTANTIEKFTLDATLGTLTRVGTTSFLGPNVFTRCVSAMLVSDQ